jgi:lipopolysaccharide transport system permease protein
LSDASLQAGLERDLRLAWRDLNAAAWRWPLIVHLSWHDIRQRYRRSTLGPLWLTISVAVQISALGFVYGGLFKLDLANYLPQLAAGMTIWALIASMINDGCNCFIVAEAYLKQAPLPKSVFPARVVLRCFFNFCHDIVIVLVVLLIYRTAADRGIALIIPGLLLLALNGLWVALLMGMLCTRFRDLPPIVASVIQVAFFVTPVIWVPSSLSGHAAVLLGFNPFAVFLSLVRDPLMGQAIPLSRWFVAFAITAAGWTVAFLAFARFRARITYWL